MRFFPGLVAIARAKHPVPSRTRPLSAVAPMVLRLKTWESRSPPDLVKTSEKPRISRKRSDALNTYAQGQHGKTRKRAKAKTPQAANRAVGHKMSRDGAAR